MKKIIYGASLGLLAALATEAHAAEKNIVCYSKKDASLYYTDGQVTLKATVPSASELQNVSLSTSGSSTLGLNESAKTTQGVARGNYIRFSIGEDAWCNYRLALPVAFAKQQKTVAFLDAYCEAGMKSSVRLFCSLR